jgi:uncharacterized membrane protein
MKYASNQQASKRNGKRSPADPRNATGRGRAALQQKVRGMNYEDGANALSPRNGNPLSPKNNSLSPVQKKSDGAQEQNVHDWAALGTQSAGAALPHLDKIQAAFGNHDVTGVKAQVGGPAKDACAGMGAEAYVSGNTVAFASSPTLHTAAHEAAHIVQQRAGVSLKGGVGKAGDPYEQHADAVADLVVQGKSAEGLLGTMAGGGQTTDVQRKEAGPEPKAGPVETVEFTEDEVTHLETPKRYVLDAAKAKAGRGTGVTVSHRIHQIMTSYRDGYEIRIASQAGALEQIDTWLGGVDFSSQNANIMTAILKEVADEVFSKVIGSIPGIGPVLNLVYGCVKEVKEAADKANKASAAAGWEDWMASQRSRLSTTARAHYGRFDLAETEMNVAYGRAVKKEDLEEGNSPAEVKGNAQRIKDTGAVAGAGAELLRDHHNAAKQFKKSAESMADYVEMILCRWVNRYSNIDVKPGPGIRCGGTIYLDAHYYKEGNAWTLNDGLTKATLLAPGAEKIVKGLNWVMKKKGKSILDLPIRKQLNLTFELETFLGNTYLDGIVRFDSRPSRADHIASNYDVSKQDYGQYWQETLPVTDSKLTGINKIEPY